MAVAAMAAAAGAAVVEEAGGKVVEEADWGAAGAEAETAEAQRAAMADCRGPRRPFGMPGLHG